MTVYFHGSFGLNRDHLAGLLKAVRKNPKAKDKELAKPFGYGAPFAARNRSWLNKSGLLKSGTPARLTDLGEIVVAKDPKLQSSTTQWLIHHELTRDRERAEAWHYFAKTFLPKHASFTRDDLLKGLYGKLGAHSMQHFGPGSTMTKVIARKLLACYTEDHALGGLGLLSVSGNTYRRLKPKKILGPWRSAADLKKSYK